MDLPAPLRPISATTSPARSCRSTPRSAGPAVVPHDRAAHLGHQRRRSPAVATPGPAPRRSRAVSSPARRRASRTDSGSGDQPASRPSSTTGGATGAVASTSAGAPTTSGRPPPGTSTSRSAYCTTRSSRCSAISTVMPRSCTSRCSSASTSSAADGSSAEVGSSSTSTRGCGVSTEPMATRCCCPADSVTSGRDRWAAMPSTSSISSTRRRITSGGDAERLHAVGQLLLDRVGDEAGERVLPDVPDDVGEVARPVLAGVAAGDGHPAGQQPAGEVRHQPVDGAQQRRLARSRCARRPAPARPRARAGRRRTAPARRCRCSGPRRARR